MSEAAINFLRPSRLAAPPAMNRKDDLQAVVEGRWPKSLPELINEGFVEMVENRPRLTVVGARAMRYLRACR